MIKMKYLLVRSGLVLLFLLCLHPEVFSQKSLIINEKGYFEKPGLNVTVFSDYYPDGHQTGVTVIQHGLRVAANGDLRLEASPGQWSPVPKKGKTVIDREIQKITTSLWYPDSSKNRRGFNPIAYPDLVLRYRISVFDFSSVSSPGIYVAGYRSGTSHAFRIDKKIYDRGVWQPVLEYFLPMQMCHMRINEKYRVWHGACHLDDALMAPAGLNHFDGYLQGPSTLTKFRPGEYVPGLNSGGWHDAGDYDLRVESQSQTIWCLASMVEEFGVYHDATLIDQENRIVEIHVPDNKSDIIQQIEHGLLSVLGGYRSLGRLYRGIICPTLRQYVLLGDGSTMTDNFVNARNEGNEDSWQPDDRWVFTEENPNRSLQVAAGLAAASRVLKSSNTPLADECIKTAMELWNTENEKANRISNKVFALSELILTTGDNGLIRTLTGMKDAIAKNFAACGPYVARVINKIPDEEFRNDINTALKQYMSVLRKASLTDSPYGVPYRPDVWGAGWTIMRFGVQQYFIHKAWPEYGSSEFYTSALNFILGLHPGENTASFASGVGSKSLLVAYGTNRADWSYIPGGVASGTGIIRPDLPELKEWPYFWQQTEYVMGEGSVDFMFLVLAVQKYYANL